MSLLSPQLQAFMAVVEHKTVHGAATEIHLTQTAVTQRIRTLEASLKTTLFIRTRRGMVLTHEGEALLRYCQVTKGLEGEALAAIQGAAIETEIELTINAPTSIMRSRVIPNCLPIMTQFPNLLIQFDTNDVEHRHKALRSGKSDLVIINEEDLTPEMKYKKLQPEKYALVASHQWKGRKLKEIIANERIIDFNPADQATFNYLKQYDLLDHAQHGRYFVNRTESLAFLVSQGLGYTTLAKEFTLPYVEKKQLCLLNSGKSYNTSPVLAWFDRSVPPKYFSAIIDAIK